MRQLALVYIVTSDSNLVSESRIDVKLFPMVQIRLFVPSQGAKGNNIAVYVFNLHAAQMWKLHIIVAIDILRIWCHCVAGLLRRWKQATLIRERSQELYTLARWLLRATSSHTLHSQTPLRREKIRNETRKRA